MSCLFNCKDCRGCAEVNEYQDVTLQPIVKFLQQNTPLLLEDFKYDPTVYSTPTNIFLGVTADCNLRCPYCFTSRHSEYMTLEMARKGVNFILQNYKLKNGEQLNLPLPSVTFFGGEPMLGYEDVIKPLIEEFGGMIEWTMTTNGTLLDEDKIDFLYQNNVGLLLSFDGIKEVQDSQRPGANFSSFDKVLEQIPYLLLRFPNLNMRATLTKKSIPHIYESYKMAEELGFKTFILGVNSFESWTDEDYLLCSQELKRIGADIYNNLINPKREGFCSFHGFDRMFNDMWTIQEGKGYYDNNILRCGMGTTTCSLCPSGIIVPCQEEITCPKNIIGNIDTGIDFALHKDFLENYYKNIEKNRCSKGCPTECYQLCQMMVCPSRMLQNDFNTYKTDCQFNQAVYNAFAPLFRLLRGNIRQDIRLYTGEDNYELSK